MCYLLQNLLPQCCGTILWGNLSYVKRLRIFNRPVQICASLYKGALNVFSLKWLFPFYVKLIFLNENNHFLYHLKHCYELVYCKNLSNSSISICMHTILNNINATAELLYRPLLWPCITLCVYCFLRVTYLLLKCPFLQLNRFVGFYYKTLSCFPDTLHGFKKPKNKRKFQCVA